MSGPTTGGAPKPGGVYLSTPRGPSSRRILDVDWNHPVYDNKVERAEHSVAAERREALEAAKALAHIAGKDRRPLLVLRECHTCSGTEDALFTKNENNERTYLLSRWFHCVKLPPDVLESNHAFRNLFAEQDPSHLFVASWDGSGRYDLSGAQSRRELWNAMEATLKANYADSPSKPLRKLANFMDKLDGLDLELNEGKTKLELLITEKGPKSPKVVKLRRKLADLRSRRTELLDEVEETAKLELKPEVKAATVTAPEAGAASAG